LNNAPAVLFHTLIRGYKPQQLPKQKNNNQKRNTEPKEPQTERLEIWIFSPFLAASTKNEERGRRRHRNQYPLGGG
jgi:hypothetical protein